MREHLIVELSNGIKYTIIDMLEESDNKYFLLAQISKDETQISDNFEICKYDSIHNNFDKIEDTNEYYYINSLFKKRVHQKKVEISIINRIDFDELIELEVTNVKEYEYKFNYNGKIIHKNIEFYSKTKLKIGDKIYVSLSILEDDMLSFGHIKDIQEVNHQNVLVIERKDKRIYLRRYYG